MTGTNDRTMPGFLDRLEVGIPGLDLITHGGLPKNRLTLVSGTAGSGKTVFAAQFLASGITGADEPGVFVTFEDRPSGIRQSLRSLGWDIAGWEATGVWHFVDASPRDRMDTVFVGEDYGLGPLVARIVETVKRAGAKRVAIDSVGALVAQLSNAAPARLALFRLRTALEDAGVTTVMTAERTEDYGPVAQLGFEEFIADNVIILRNALDGEKRRRTIEVLKMRGGQHLKGEHLFTLLTGEGIVVVPIAIDSFTYTSSNRRLTSGVPELDNMLCGGLFEKSLWLVSGPTGTGKSLLSALFCAGGVVKGQRSLLHSFEESHDQILRNASGWGIDMRQMEAQGNLRIMAEAPEAASLEDHLQRMKKAIDDFRPDRVAIDSLTALQRIATVKSFREYVLGLTFHIKLNSLVGMVTTNVADFLGSTSSNELHVSSISDAIALLHYVPVGGELRRGVQILKLRGSDHDKAVREFTISNSGMTIGDPFHDISRLV